MIILDAKTGFTITEKGRKDLRDDVKGVFETWDKLFELRKVEAIERSSMEAIAAGEKLEREYLEKKKKEAEKLAAEGGGPVGADMA